ncbi:MAG: DNA methyltransferase [Planctomycetota bacterium]
MVKKSKKMKHPQIQIYLGDNIDIIRKYDEHSFDLIYIDPPFNTGKKQSRQSLQTVKDSLGDRIGFKGQRYRTESLGAMGYNDSFDDFTAFIESRLREAYRLLTPDGSFFFHIDYREVHYCKVLLDGIFGRESFINEIIWAYDYGARSKKRWSAKHDTILWYAKNPKRYTFNYDAIDRIPYMAPGLVGEEKAARGKTPTDCWWNTIVSPTGKEKTGYPTQKPLAIIERIVKVHSNPGDKLLDFFAGSGTFGVAAAKNGRDCVLIDSNSEAIDVMTKRLAFAEPTVIKQPKRKATP